MEYVRLAFCFLVQRQKRTWLTMIGIFIGIAAVVALISLGQGMREAIDMQFATVGRDKIIVQGAAAGFGPPGQNTAARIGEQDLKVVRKVLGVRRAAGRIIRSVNLEFADETITILGSSIPEEHEDRDLVMEANNIQAEHGRVLQPDDKKRVMVGYHLWSVDHFSKKLRIGEKIHVNSIEFEITGFLRKIGVGRDETIMLNEEDMYRVFNESDELSVVVAQIDAGESPARVADRVLRELRRSRGQEEGFEDFTVSTSEELFASIGIILGVVQAVFVGIAFVSLVVGGLGIMSTMYTSVLERTRDIGIMKAVGARNRDVFCTFLFESGFLGLSGGVLGVVFGIVLSKGVVFVAQDFMGDLVHVVVSPELVIGALVFSFFLGVVSGVLPALQASSLLPVEALSHE